MALPKIYCLFRRMAVFSLPSLSLLPMMAVVMVMMAAMAMMMVMMHPPAAAVMMMEMAPA